MNETIKNQILAIRASGLTNMFDTVCVQQLAFKFAMTGSSFGVHERR